MCVCSQPTQTSPIVKVWIREVEITVKLAVVKFHCDGVMGFLVNRPDTTGQVQTFNS